MNTRRNFLKSVGGAAGLAVAGGCLSFPGATVLRRRSAETPLNVALIGVGGRGTSHVNAVCRSGEVPVALCDVDEAALFAARDMAASRNPDVRLYKDFRVMFESEKALDAVFVSTPDHMHGIQTAWALSRDCHVYLETPAVRTLGEWRELQTRARSRGLFVQLGNQGSALDEFRRAVELVSGGVIGHVSEVHAWTLRPLWPQGMNRPDGSDSLPSSLDWDLWLGVAPIRPYKDKAYHRFNWRAWTDFGTGALGDGGGHLLNLPFRALDLDAPVAAEALNTSGRCAETFAKASRVRFDFAAHGKRQPVTLYWYDGGMTPPAELLPQMIAGLGRLPDSGCLLIGDQGQWLMTDDFGKRHYLALAHETRAVDAEKHPAYQTAALSLPRVKSQQQEFFDAVRSGERPYSDVRREAPLMETLLTGCLAQRLEGRLAWNSRKGLFASPVSANAFVTPAFRDGWAYPV
jgi:predicted dehydrogenase